MAITAEQFNKLVTRDDLKEELKGVAKKEDTNKILAAVDAVKKKVGKKNRG